MPDTKKQSSIMAALTICVVFVALISFFLPLYSVNFFGTYSYSGFDAVMDAMDDPEFPELGIALCLACSIIGMGCSLMAMKNSKAGIGTIVTSAVGMILMIVAMSDDSDILKAIDYAAVGFYLFEIMHFAAIILSAATIYKSKTTALETNVVKPTPAPVPEPAPAPKPVASAKHTCPKCKAEQEKDAVFCRFCGASLGTSKPVSVPNPIPCPAPDPKPAPIKKDGKVICPHCGARHAEGTVKCKYCGTAFSGTIGGVSSESIPEPYPMFIPKPAPVDKPAKKAVCPHCGARQGSDVVNCKYCGTPMH